MRFPWIVALIVCAGCPVNGSDCDVDNECEPSEVCARTHVCVRPDEVRAIRTTWTINGAAPNKAVCEAFPLDFQILFKVDLNELDTEKLGFSPVPCFTGLFTIDKLPIEFTAVKLIDENPEATQNTVGSTLFDSEGIATIDITVP